MIYTGDSLTTLQQLPASSVHCCITSPPYWGLRDYGVGGQLGLEPTPEEYVDNLVDVFRGVRRVLRDDGTLWLNLGDSYAGSWGNQGRKKKRGGQRPVNGPMISPVHDGRYPDKGTKTGTPPPGLKNKDLMGMPWRVAFALQADGWYLRQDIIWHKPNPMPESCRDRCTKAHEYLFLLTKKPRYYYDHEAVKEPAVWQRKNNPEWQHQRSATNETKGCGNRNAKSGGFTKWDSSQGRNRRSVWTITTKPYKGAHFATFPPALVEPCILAGTSEKGCCPECEAPWKRIVKRKAMEIRRSKRTHSKGRTRSSGTMVKPPESETVGWEPGCKCGAPAVGCTVLDPFAGSGTVAQVAQQHGRNFVMIELNPEYVELMKKRLAT